MIERLNIWTFEVTRTADTAINFTFSISRSEFNFNVTRLTQNTTIDIERLNTWGFSVNRDQ